MDYLIGIDLGGTNIKAGLVNQEGNILSKKSIKTEVGRLEIDIVQDMGRLAQSLIKEANLRPEQIKAIGTGSPGTPDNKNGILVYANNLRFTNIPMRKWIKEIIDLPVYIENDANCAALAESEAGAAKGSNISVTITIGTGIGSGVVVDKKIFSGFNQAAAEIGHMVVEVGGESCTCGRFGCFEAYGSASGLIRMTQEAADKYPDSILNQYIAAKNGRADGRQAFDGAKVKDAAAEMVVEKYIHYLSEGLANVINIFMPEYLVIGGGVCNEGDNLLVPLKEKTMSKPYKCEGLPKTKIVLAEMGNDAGIVGAAMMARACLEQNIPG